MARLPQESIIYEDSFLAFNLKSSNILRIIPILPVEEKLLCAARRKGGMGVMAPGSQEIAALSIELELAEGAGRGGGGGGCEKL